MTESPAPLPSSGASAIADALNRNRNIGRTPEQINAERVPAKPTKQQEPYTVGKRVEVQITDFETPGFPKKWATGTVDEARMDDNGLLDVRVKLDNPTPTGGAFAERQMVGKRGGNRQLRPVGSREAAPTGPAAKPGETTLGVTESSKGRTTTVTLPDGTTAKRTSQTMAYTHAVVGTTDNHARAERLRGDLVQQRAYLDALKAWQARGSKLSELKGYPSGGSYADQQEGRVNIAYYLPGFEPVKVPVRAGRRGGSGGHYWSASNGQSVAYAHHFKGDPNQKVTREFHRDTLEATDAANLRVAQGTVDRTEQAIADLAAGPQYSYHVPRWSQRADTAFAAIGTPEVNQRETSYQVVTVGGVAKPDVKPAKHVPTLEEKAAAKLAAKEEEKQRKADREAQFVERTRGEILKAIDEGGDPESALKYTSEDGLRFLARGLGAKLPRLPRNAYGQQESLDRDNARKLIVEAVRAKRDGGGAETPATPAASARRVVTAGGVERDVKAGQYVQVNDPALPGVHRVRKVNQSSVALSIVEPEFNDDGSLRKAGMGQPVPFAKITDVRDAPAAPTAPAKAPRPLLPIEQRALDAAAARPDGAFSAPAQVKAILRAQGLIESTGPANHYQDRLTAAGRAKATPAVPATSGLQTTDLGDGRTRVGGLKPGTYWADKQGRRVDNPGQTAIVRGDVKLHEAPTFADTNAVVKPGANRIQMDLMHYDPETGHHSGRMYLPGYAPEDGEIAVSKEKGGQWVATDLPGHQPAQTAANPHALMAKVGKLYGITGDGKVDDERDGAPGPNYQGTKPLTTASAADAPRRIKTSEIKAGMQVRANGMYPHSDEFRTVRIIVDDNRPGFRHVAFEGGGGGSLSPNTKVETISGDLPAVPVGATDAQAATLRPRIEGESDFAYSIRTATSRDAVTRTLEGYSVSGLRAIARDEKVTVASGATKPQLVERIRGALYDRAATSRAIDTMARTDRPTAPTPAAPAAPHVAAPAGPAPKPTMTGAELLAQRRAASAANLEKGRAVQREKKVEELRSSTEPTDNGAKVKALVEGRIDYVDLYRKVMAGPSGQRRDIKVGRVRHTPDNPRGEFSVVDGNGQRAGWATSTIRDGETKFAVHSENADGGTELLGWADSVAHAADVLVNGETAASTGGNADARRISGRTFERNPNRNKTLDQLDREALQREIRQTRESLANPNLTPGLRQRAQARLARLEAEQRG